VFALVTDAPPHPDTIRQRFYRLAAAPVAPCIRSMALRHSHATGRRRLKAGVSPKITGERTGPNTDTSR